MSQIVIDPDPLSPSFLPEKLLHREEEYKQLSGNIKNRINTIILGPIGSGKTALIKLAMHDIKDLLYIDCLLYSTEYSVLKEIIPSNRFIVCRSNYELFKELQKIAKERKLVVCFDNFTQLKNIDVIKKMMSIGICIILVGRVERNSPSLNQNILSNIPSFIRLHEYSVEQTLDILKERAKLALNNWSYTESPLRRIAERVGGNITLAVNVLRIAALKAESENKKSIDEIDLNSLLPQVDCLDELSNDERIVFKILSEHKSLPSNQLYTMYVQTAKYPKCERSFRNYMESLFSKGLVKAIGDKKGRVYEIVESNASVEGNAHET